MAGAKVDVLFVFLFIFPMSDVNSHLPRSLENHLENFTRELICGCFHGVMVDDNEIKLLEWLKRWIVDAYFLGKEDARER